MKFAIEEKKTDLMKIKEVVVDLLGISVLAGILICLCNAANEPIQTLMDIAYAKAIFLLAVFFFITQRVRLINWQSIVVSLLYSPLGYMYREGRELKEFAPDLYNRDRVVSWIAWIVLMVIVDMIVYKKYTKLTGFSKVGLALFAAAGIFMVFFRNGRNYPIMFLLAFVFYLIPMTEDKWKRMTNQFCYGWIGAFFIILYRSLINNPLANAWNGRWYGDFTNIGDFGQFLACVTAVCLYKLYQTKRDKRRFSVEYIFWAVCMLPLGWAVLRVCTVTMFIGIIMIFLLGFVVIRKKNNAKLVGIRLGCIVVCGAVLMIGGFWFLKGLAEKGMAYWLDVLQNGSLFMKPIANLGCRADYMFNHNNVVAGAQLFEPGSFIAYLDSFTSGRLSLIKTFSEYFNFTGNPSMVLFVGTYGAWVTHNTYSQLIFEYGYIAGGLFIAWLLYCMGAAVKRYVKKRTNVAVLTCIWLVMVLGILLGENAHLYFPSMMMTFIMVRPILVKED